MFEVVVELDEMPRGMHPFDVVFDYEALAEEGNAFDLFRLQALTRALDYARADLKLPRTPGS